MFSKGNQILSEGSRSHILQPIQIFSEVRQSQMFSKGTQHKMFSKGSHMFGNGSYSQIFSKDKSLLFRKFNQSHVNIN